MGRAERRAKERSERLEYNKNTVRMTPHEIQKIKDEITQQVSAFSTETFLTCFALTLRDNHGFGYRRIFRDLQSIDDMMNDILEDRCDIEDLKERLKNETGVVIKG